MNSNKEELSLEMKSFATYIKGLKENDLFSFRQKYNFDFQNELPITKTESNSNRSYLWTKLESKTPDKSKFEPHLGIRKSDKNFSSEVNEADEFNFKKFLIKQINNNSNKVSSTSVSSGQN